MARLETLPLELLTLIADTLAIPDLRNTDHSNGLSGLACLIRCSRILRNALEGRLYDIDVNEGHAYSLYWACVTGNISAMKKAVSAVKDDDVTSATRGLVNTEWIIRGLSGGGDESQDPDNPSPGVDLKELRPRSHVVDIVSSLGQDVYAKRLHCLDREEVPEPHAIWAYNLWQMHARNGTRDFVQYEHIVGVLHIAIHFGNTAIFELLLDMGANINNWSSPLCTCKELPLEEWVDHHIHVYPPLHVALCERQLDMARSLLSRGANISYMWAPSPGGEDILLWSALSDCALFTDDGDMATTMLESESDLANICAPGMELPLITALDANHQQVARAIVVHGNIERRAPEYDRLMRHAVKGHYSIPKVKWLHELGFPVDIDKSSSYVEISSCVEDDSGHMSKDLLIGGTVLHQTQVWHPDSSQELLPVLLDVGVGISHPSIHYLTPLHIVAFNLKPDYVRMFLKAGADVNAIDSNGRCPITLACKRRYTGATDPEKRLLKGSKWGHFIYPRIVNPILIATIERQAECIDLLVSYGADIHSKRPWNGVSELPVPCFVSTMSPLQFLCHSVGTMVEMVGVSQGEAEWRAWEQYIALPARLALCRHIIVNYGVAMFPSEDDRSLVHIWTAARLDPEAAYPVCEALVRVGAIPKSQASLESLRKTHTLFRKCIATLLLPQSLARYHALPSSEVLERSGERANHKLLAKDGALARHFAKWEAVLRDEKHARNDILGRYETLFLEVDGVSS